MAERATDQTIEAFSAPVSFINRAKAEAKRRGMTKSGFYRYCLAKEIGYAEDQAIAISKFMPLARMEPAFENRGDYPSHQPEPSPALNEPTQAGAASAEEAAEAEEKIKSVSNQLHQHRRETRKP